MNSAAAYSAKLIQDFEDAQEQPSERVAEYPSRYPFGSAGPGPFGGASSDESSTQGFVQRTCQEESNGAMSLAECDVSFVGGAGPDEDSSRNLATIATHRGELNQYDYPAGWGAQTHEGCAGLTQDSAARLATLQAKLNQRLGPEYLSQRPGPGGGKKLTYIEGWKLVDLANEVFGFNGWSTTIVRLDVDYLDCSPDGTRFNTGISCVIRVTLRDGAFHEDIGYGSAENARQKHAALEKGKKEAVTDATKRALKNFGKLLGNCTYDHQYSTQALKVINPVPKFDPSELHRRPELRPPAPSPAPKLPQLYEHGQSAPPTPLPATGQSATMTNPPAPAMAATSAPQKQVARLHESTSTSKAASILNQNGPMGPPAPTTNTTLPAQVLAQKHAETGAVKSNIALALETAAENDAAAARQQRSLRARQAYLERQQAEAAKMSDSGLVTNGAEMAEPHCLQKNDRELDLGSDSFDEGLSDVLANYDETETGDAEAASMALEMEIAEAEYQCQEAGESSEEIRSLADDSGVAFPTSELVLIKKTPGAPDGNQRQVPEVRRSLSPVKQVKAEAMAKPRRAGSVGRFISPPPTSDGPRPGAVTRLKNGTTSLSAASAAGSRDSTGRLDSSSILPSRSLAKGAATGIEGTVHREAGQAIGHPVNHSFVGGGMRGVKRPSDTAADAVRRPASAIAKRP
nr:DNA repair and recombination protein [Tranzscheliella williamsii]